MYYKPCQRFVSDMSGEEQNYHKHRHRHRLTHTCQPTHTHLKVR